jgi:hypothetical protein
MMMGRRLSSAIGRGLDLRFVVVIRAVAALVEVDLARQSDRRMVDRQAVLGLVQSCDRRLRDEQGHQRQA